MGGQGENVEVCFTLLVLCLIVVMGSCDASGTITAEEKRQLRDKTVEMFNHAYNAYMTKAYPADELMPLSCKGRYRGSEASRGDIDDTLGNFTLTLIDSLDTLAVFGNITEFERAIRLVVRDARFDADTVVSVFETNIRILGGLLGGHVAAIFFKNKGKGLEWYRNELLAMAKEVGDRLLPAFNTTTGIPYPRINLKHGITQRLASATRDTCTSCAGTMILEFAALSRLTGLAVYEEKAHKAMDYLWSQRHRSSDLMGTVINLHNGDWIRRESGVGAGIDSYYEYVLKAYVLLGDDTYLARFNKHYDAVKKYIRQGPLLVDVHMHKPTSTSRNFMDALLAFWPGLQVMFGDIGSAVETHEMLYQVVQRHNFLPEAFTTDFRVHWAQHPLRPEFLESTYFLYEATWDPYYLEVGKKVLNNLEEHARVECGFAAIKDLKKGTLEDQMDSYVLAETFKYLFLLFSDKEDVAINVENFVFTTEAHLLPLSLSVGNYSWKAPTKPTPDIYKFDMMSVAEMTKAADDDVSFYPVDGDDGEGESPKPGTCRNYQVTVPGGFAFVHSIRAQLRDLVDSTHPKLHAERPRLRASDFVAGNKEHMEMLHHMGIRISTMPDGRIQLLHTAADALSQDYAEAGLDFMQEMIALSKLQKQDSQHEPMFIKLLSPPFNGQKNFRAGPAQFGYNLNGNPPISGKLVVTEPFKACDPISNSADLVGKIALLERGDCMFVDKARNLQKNGAIGGIVFDSSQGSSSDSLTLFAMSGDGTHDVRIPMVFLFHQQGQQLMSYFTENPELEVELTNVETDGDDGTAASKVPATSAADDFSSAQCPDGVSPSPVAAHDESRPSSPHSSSSTSSFSSSSPSPSVPDPSASTLTKAEHGFYHSDFLDVSTKQYFLQAGTRFVHLNVEATLHESPDTIPAVGTEERRRLKVDPLPDGSHMFNFYFHYKSHQMEGREKPILNEIYLDLIHTLQHRTNLETLPRASEYMKAIARFLESAYLGLDRIDRTALELMRDFCATVQVKHFYPQGQQGFVTKSPHLASGPTADGPEMTMPAGDGDGSRHQQHQSSSSSRSSVKISVKTRQDGSYHATAESAKGNSESNRHSGGERGGVRDSSDARRRDPGAQVAEADPDLPVGPEAGFYDDVAETDEPSSPSSNHHHHPGEPPSSPESAHVRSAQEFDYSEGESGQDESGRVKEQSGGFVDVPGENVQRQIPSSYHSQEEDVQLSNEPLSSTGEQDLQRGPSLNEASQSGIHIRSSSKSSSSPSSEFSSSSESLTDSTSSSSSSDSLPSPSSRSDSSSNKKEEL